LTLTTTYLKEKKTMRVLVLAALFAIIAVALAQKPQRKVKFDPKNFAKCVADKLGINVEKAVSCALSCKTDINCYPSCLGITDKEKVIEAAIECLLAGKGIKPVKKGPKKPIKGPKKPIKGPKKLIKGSKISKQESKKPKQESKKPKQVGQKKALDKILKKKVPADKIASEKKKVKAILKRLVAKAKRQAKIVKLPLKDQVKIVKDKLNKRISILENIIRKVTIVSKKDDAEKKLLKGMLREFAVKDLLKATVQKALLYKITKKEKKGTKVPKKGTKKPKNGSKKPKKVTKAKFLSDSEFLGKFGKWLGNAAKKIGRVALNAGKEAAINAAVGAITA
jgi:hypothetical protein